MSGERLRARAKKVQWMIDNEHTWRGKHLRESHDLVIAGMKAAGLYSPCTLSIDIAVHRLIDEAKAELRRRRAGWTASFATKATTSSKS